MSNLIVEPPAMKNINLTQDTINEARTMDKKHVRVTVLVPPDLHPRLKALALSEERSVSKEIISLIKQALKEKNL